MSRYYGMSVEIKHYNRKNKQAIKHAANDEWASFADDWFEHDNVLTAHGEGSLCGGERDDEFATRLTHAIWQTNGAFCEVVVTATYLEDLPHEQYSLSSEDYKRFITPADIAPPST